MQGDIVADIMLNGILFLLAGVYRDFCNATGFVFISELESKWNICSEYTSP